MNAVMHKAHMYFILICSHNVHTWPLYDLNDCKCTTLLIWSPRDGLYDVPIVHVEF